MRAVVFSTAVIAGVVWLGIAPAKTASPTVPGIGNTNFQTSAVERVGFRRRYYRRHGYPVPYAYPPAYGYYVPPAAYAYPPPATDYYPPADGTYADAPPSDGAYADAPPADGTYADAPPPDAYADAPPPDGAYEYYGNRPYGRYGYRPYPGYRAGSAYRRWR